MNWDAFARDLKDKWDTLDPPARAAAVRRWKKESNRSNRQLALILGKSESALRAVLSSVEKKNEQQRATEGTKSACLAVPGDARGRASALPSSNVVSSRSSAPTPPQQLCAPSKPAPVSTVVEQIIAWMERLQISDVDRRTVADDIRFQLNDNRLFVKRDIAKFGVATLEVRPPDLGPGDLGDLSIWGPWVARVLWLHPQREAIVTELKRRCQEEYSLSSR